MKVGIFTVSMPEFYPLEVLEITKKLGYDGVEWRVCTDKGDCARPSFWEGNRTTMTAEELIAKAPELKRAAAKLGVKMPSLGTCIDCYDLKVVELHMQAAKAIGAQTLRISPGEYNLQQGKYTELLEKARRQYAKVAKLAAQYGVRAVIETHPRLLTPSMSTTMRVLEGLDPKHVGVMWDPGNQVREGLEVYPMALDIAGEYLAEVHVKNLRYEVKDVAEGQLQWQPISCPVRTGIVNWPQVLRNLKAAGYSGWFFFEDFSTEAPILERLKNNLDWFRAFAA